MRLCRTQGRRTHRQVRYSREVEVQQLGLGQVPRGRHVSTLHTGTRAEVRTPICSRVGWAQTPQGPSPLPPLLCKSTAKWTCAGRQHKRRSRHMPQVLLPYSPATRHGPTLSCSSVTCEVVPPTCPHGASVQRLPSGATPLWPLRPDVSDTRAPHRRLVYLPTSGATGAGLRGLSLRSGSNLRYKDCFLRADSLN